MRLLLHFMQRSSFWRRRKRLADAESRNVGQGSLLCQQTGKPEGWISHANDAAGKERIEAFFSGRGYEMHRHDTYAIGRTLSGVQSFHYRGAIRNSLPGVTMVLHPDEAHDGQAGADDGFHYRIAYVEPAAIQSVLGGRPLPFIQGGISNDPRLFAATSRLLRKVEDRIEAFEYQDAMFDLAQALEAASDGAITRKRKRVDYTAAEMARQFLHDGQPSITLEQLETICGRDKWSLSRDFRLLFGTSPYRYLTMRRLDAIKIALRKGQSLADAAFDAGFADQSHMTRQFSRAFGMPPGQWLALAQLHDRSRPAGR